MQIRKNKQPTPQQYGSYQPHTQPAHSIKKGFFSRINIWLKTHPRKSLLGLVLFLIILGGGFLFYLHTIKIPTDSALIKTTYKPKVFYSPLTGREVDEADSKRPVIGAMIENSPEARPQSGLFQSGVVFESVAEAGITRFLALYQEDKPDVIGPIRSVRPQFASLVAAFDAGLAHVGGSDIPLQKLRSGQIKDLDQFFSPDAYRRAGDRYAPHNVYTSYQALYDLAVSKGYTSSTFTSWQREKKATPAETPTASSITIPVSTGIYSVQYQWDPATNEYARSMGGVPHMDREKGQIKPNVIVALQVPHDVIRDSNGYSYPDVNTSGTGWLFQNGIIQDITWKKGSDKEQISLTDTTGKPAILMPGQTWISLLRQGSVPTWQ